MADPLRNLRLHWNRLVRTPMVTLAGVRLKSDLSQPRFVRDGLFKRTYEQAEQVLLQQAVRPGDTVLEIGAGIGFIGLLSARLAGPAGRVVSYEANPRLQPVIEANYALNPLRPELRMRAITPDGADVTFHIGDNVVSSSLYQRAETQSAVTVPSDALDRALADLAPDVLVMDVEGAEVDLLAQGDLAPVRAAVIELHPHVVGPARIDALLSGLAARGFTVARRLEKNVLLVRDRAG